MPTTIENNPLQAGQPAAYTAVYGPHNRFGLTPIHTRFDAVAWVVTDAETLADDGSGLCEKYVFATCDEARAYIERRVAEAEAEAAESGNE